MPLTKVDDDTERKRQRRAASPSERGRRSERAPWSRARDANRKRQERSPSRTPSRTPSAGATGQALSKKARALARIRPFVHSITAPAPAQQLKCQPLAFDDSSREAATASGLAIVKVFFEDRNMERPTCACCNELKAPSRTSEYRGGRQLARAHSHTTHLGAHRVCLLRRSHRQHQKALFVRGPFVRRGFFGSQRCGHR